MALTGNEGGITCRQKATDIQGGIIENSLPIS